MTVLDMEIFSGVLSVPSGTNDLYDILVRGSEVGPGCSTPYWYIRILKEAIVEHCREVWEGEHRRLAYGVGAGRSERGVEEVGSFRRARIRSLAVSFWDDEFLVLAFGTVEVHFAVEWLWTSWKDGARSDGVDLRLCLRFLFML